MTFKAARTVITLDGQDLMQLQEILMDEDSEQAISFLRDVIGEKIRCAQDDSHRPEFEGGIRPDRTHHPRPAEAHEDSGEAG
jgi:hypothetical protein